MITDNTLIYMFHFAIAYLISRIQPSTLPVPVIQRRHAVYG